MFCSRNHLHGFLDIQRLLRQAACGRMRYEISVNDAVEKNPDGVSTTSGIAWVPRWNWQTTGKMSISESISHFLSISSSSPRPSGCEPSFSASAVARSYSSPTSCSELPLSSLSQSQRSRPLPSSKPVAPPPQSTPPTSTLSSMYAGTLNSLSRRLGFSLGRPARNEGGANCVGQVFATG